MSGVDRLVFCGRGPEECDGIAEPEEDGEVRFYKCAKPECGFEFGYHLIAPPEPDACQLGIPEEVRRQAIDLNPLTTDPEFQRRLAALPVPDLPGESGTTVFLGSLIPRRAE